MFPRKAGIKINTVMAQKGETKEVQIFRDDIYDPSIIRETLKTFYGGTTGGINHIYLYRYDEEQKRFASLRKYDDLPELDDIRKEFGGGQYQIWVTYDDPDTKTGRNLEKCPVYIEGDAIQPYHKAAIVNGHPQHDEDDEEKFFKRMEQFERMRNLYHPAEVSKQDNSAFAEVIKFQIESMKESREMILKMMETMGANKNDKFTELLLTSALTRNKGELEIFEKAFNIANKHAPGDGETSWLKEAAPLLMPVIGKLLGPKAPAPGAGIAGPATQLPAGNPMELLTQAIQQAVKPIADAVQSIDKRLHEIEEWAASGDEETDFIPGENGAENIHEINQKELNQKGETELNAIYNKLATDLKNASPEEKTKQLTDWVNTAGVQKTYEWCAKYPTDAPLVKDVSEFNEYMRKANLPEYIPA